MTATAAQAPPRPARRHARLIKTGLAAAVVLAAIGVIVTTSFSATAYYLTVAELRSRGLPSDARVAGVVETGSIARDSSVGGPVQFRISDAGGSLLVVYSGAVPDAFADGAEVIVEGRYDPAGVFTAKTLSAKCPSRFEAAVTPATH